MNRLLAPALITIALLAGCQQPVGGRRQSLFDFSQPPALLSQNNRPAWLGGSGNNTAASNSPGNNPLSRLFAGRGGNQTPQGIQLPSDPNQQAEWFNSLAAQVQTLNSRLSQFDSDNQQLHTELAAYRQRIQAAGDYNYQLKQQLTDTIAQLQQLQNDKLNLEQQLAAARLGNPGGVNGQPPGQLVSSGGGVPAQLPGAAVLRANNSLLQQLPQFRIPGVVPRMDGDVIRIEIPSDPLFVPGTYQIASDHAAMLQEVAASITRTFPRQIVGIEAHWDGAPIQPANVTPHQLTMTQTLAVFEFLKRAGVPEKQLFTMGMGNNRPRHPAGGPTNRRVEIVIYPEYWDGRQ